MLLSHGRTQKQKGLRDDDDDDDDDDNDNSNIHGESTQPMGPTILTKHSEVNM